MGKSVGNLYVSLGLNTTPFTKGMHDAQDKLRRFQAASSNGKSAFAGLAGSIDITSSALSRLNGLLAVGAMAAGVKTLIDISDKYTQLEGRLRLVTKSTQEFQTAQSGLYKIAQETRVAYADTVDLYTRMARSTDALGISQTDLLTITESINKALIVSGASGESASAALMQLGQGMASGVLRGEELNSVLEQTPRLAQMIADGMGVTIGQLRELGKEGKLTSEAVTQALLSQSKAIDTEFGKMEVTVSQAMTNLKTVFESIIAEANNTSGATNSIAGAVQDLASTIDANRGPIIQSFNQIAAAAINTANAIVKAISFAQKLMPLLNAGAAFGARGGFQNPFSSIPAGIGQYNNTIANQERAARIAAEGTGGSVVLDALRGLKDSPGKISFTPTPTGGGKGGGKKSGGAAKKDTTGADFERLQNSLLSPIEEEEKRYQESLDLIEKYYGDRAALTTEDDELRLKLTEEHQKKIDEIAGVTAWDREMESMQDRYKTSAEAEQERYDEQIERLQEFLDLKAITEEEYESRREAAAQLHSDKVKAIADREAQAKLAAAQNFFSMISSMSAGKNKALLAIQKAAAVASAVIAARESVIDAYKWGTKVGGPAVGAAFAAVAGVAQAANIASLIASGGGSEGGSGSSGGYSSRSSATQTATAAQAPLNSTLIVEGINESDLFTGQMVKALAEKLLAYQKDGGKVIFATA